MGKDNPEKPKTQSSKTRSTSNKPAQRKEIAERQPEVDTACSPEAQKSSNEQVERAESSAIGQNEQFATYGNITIDKNFHQPDLDKFADAILEPSSSKTAHLKNLKRKIDTQVSSGSKKAKEDSPSRELIEMLLSRIQTLEDQASHNEQKTEEGEAFDDVSDGEIADPTDHISEAFDLGQDHDQEYEENDFTEVLLEGTELTRKGKPLNKDAMKIVEHFFDKEYDPKMLKPIRERHLEPENCSNVSAKTLNPEVNRGLMPWQRKRDSNLSNIEHSVATSATASLRLIDSISELSRRNGIKKEEAVQLLILACDASKLSAKALGDIALLRKSFLKSHVEQKYQPLCDKRTFGSSLFGDDFSKEVKSINEESRIMRSVKRGNGRFENRPPSAFNQSGFNQPKNWYARGRAHGRPPFRGQRPFRARGRSSGPPKNIQAS